MAKDRSDDHVETISESRLVPVVELLAVLVLSLYCLIRGSELTDLCTSGEWRRLGAILALVALTCFYRGPARIASIAVLYGFLRYRFDVLVYEPPSDMILNGTIAVITGASNGMGLSLAQQLAVMNVTLLLGCRNISKCERHKPAGDITCLELDLSDLSNVAAFSAEVHRRVSHIDILVNNAGVVNDVGSLSAQGFELGFGVMHLGHFLLTRELWPLLATPSDHTKLPARVVNHASAAMQLGYFHNSFFDSQDDRTKGEGDLRGEIMRGCIKGLKDLWVVGAGLCPVTGTYPRAKLAQVLFTQELQERAATMYQREYATTAHLIRKVVVSTLHPGTVRSGMLPLPEWLARPTSMGARVLLFCIFEDFPGGSYVDALQRPHDLSFDQPRDQQLGVFSAPTWFYRRATEGDPRLYRARLWDVSEHLVASYASRPWPF